MTRKLAVIVALCSVSTSVVGACGGTERPSAVLPGLSTTQMVRAVQAIVNLAASDSDSVVDLSACPLGDLGAYTGEVPGNHCREDLIAMLPDLSSRSTTNALIARALSTATVRNRSVLLGKASVGPTGLTTTCGLACSCAATGGLPRIPKSGWLRF